MRRTFGNWMITLEHFGENRLEFEENIQDNHHLTNNFHRAGKLRNLRAKFCAFGQKTKKILKNFKKILRFFDQISMEN